jgi:hypothetical protein
MAVNDVDSGCGEDLTSAEKRELSELHRKTRLLEVDTRFSDARQHVS